MRSPPITEIPENFSFRNDRNKVLQFRTPAEKETDFGELLSSPYELCQFLRNRMLASGMKISDIARKADVSHTTVSRLLYGETKDPRCNTAIRLMLAMGHKLYAK